MNKTILFAALAAMTPVANADVFATAHVKGDLFGKGILTTEPCALPDKPAGMKRIFMYTGKGETHEGCWQHDNGTVLLMWDDGAVRRWPVRNFKLTATSWESVK